MRRCSVAKIAVFGGAFDPTTLGHILSGMAVNAQTGMRVWYMPCYAHKYGKNPASPEDRCWMLTKSIAHMGNPWLQVNYHEIEKKGDGATFDTMHELREKNPEDELYVMVGADNFNDVETKWYRGKDLLSDFPFVVLSRPGYDLTRQVRPQDVAVDFRWPISSTDVRKACESGDIEFVKRNTLYPVSAKIRSQGLYGYKGRSNA